MSSSPIAVVGIGCQYPGAAHPRHLWENVLARRQEFRRFLDQRLPVADYCNPDPAAPDKIYATRAAYMDGFDFDWSQWRIPKRAFESTDIAQWLALEVARRALEDAGFTRESVPKNRTGVVVGNSLTGEHMRSSTLRLRWPFVKRAFLAAANAKGLPKDAQEEFAALMEGIYKSVFPEVTEDTLAGGLSNTIAGRICNYFDLHGGGYVVDGACASSLLAVCTAADYLANHSWDVAITGGVDISLDPFELVGFAKATALTADEMNVYDRRGAGFIAGEGCGFVVLKRLEDARAAGDTIYAVLRGWGVSSDGKGGITAPSHQGQAVALRRAYARAGYSPHALDFIEGHGTGTRVGDRVELQGIAAALDAHGPLAAKSCGVTSFKSIVGHTKAAAGIGAFIKATLAVNRRVLPPTAGCKEPNPVFDEDARSLYPILQGQIRPASETLRAGVSAMGFGGINSHVTLESGDAPSAKFAPAIEERALLAADQDSEILVLGAPSIAELRQRLVELADTAELLSVGDLTDFAAHLARELEGNSAVRAAVIAARPDHAAERLRGLEAVLRERTVSEGELLIRPDRTAWVGYQVQKTRLGFLFPGQGSQQLAMGRVLVERFSWARELVERVDRCTTEAMGSAISPLLYANLDRATEDEQQALERSLAQTDVAQPAICLASVLYARYLERLGLRPAILGGHSLGEATAFHLAGAFDEDTLFRLVALRGQAMAATPDQAGTMASLACSPEQAAELTKRVAGLVVVANINSPHQVVISGETPAVSQVLALAEREGIEHRALRVSSAFHSPLMVGAAETLRGAAPLPKHLGDLSATLLSCMEGEPVAPGLDLNEHFASLILAQVQFVRLVERMQQDCDLMIEVGPGRVLSGLADAILERDGATCSPVASRPGAARDLNLVLAQAFVHGVDCNWEVLYEGRLVRPFVPASERTFIDNPCERPFAPPDAAVIADSHAPIAKPGALESALLDATDLSAPEFQAYLARRQGFLVDFVKSDLRWLSPTGPAPARSATVLPMPDRTERRPTTALAPVDTKAAIQTQGADSVETALTDLIAERTGFPAETITLDARLLDDLNLDSIKAGELIAAVAKQTGVAGALDVSSLANSTLADIADAIRDAERPTGTGVPPQAPQPVAAVSAPPKGSDPVSNWVRNFVIQYVAEAAQTEAPSAALWRDQSVLIVAEAAQARVAKALRGRLKFLGAQVAEARLGDSARVDEKVHRHYAQVIAVLPERASTEADERLSLLKGLERLHSTVRGALACQSRNIAFVQFGGGRFGTGSPLGDPAACGVASFARSLHLDHPDLRVRVVDLALSIEPAAAADRVLSELTGPEPFAAVGYASEALRLVPRATLQEPALYPKRALRWSQTQVVLVTGGAKGITAECALALARSTNAKFALVGSSPAPQPGDRSGGEVAQTLERFANESLTARYYPCDLTRADEVQALVAKVRAELGPIQAVVHGAGMNKARRVEQVELETALAEVSPKLLGARHLCQALADAPPRLFVGFTSIIGVAGMAGNAWYGYSNEVLDLTLRRFQAEHPETAVLSVAYSVWADTGMGVRMGVVERLAKIGVGAIPSDEGVRRFLQLVECDPGEKQVVVTAAAGGLATWKGLSNPYPRPTAHRFIEQVVEVEPGVALLARTRLSVERDRYLDDHNFRGSRLFPTVFGLEAMAQATLYLTGAAPDAIARIEDINLRRPIVVDPQEGVEIELRAIAHEQTPEGERQVQVGIRTEQSGFESDHFSATLVLGPRSPGSKEPLPRNQAPLALDPHTDLYGGLLFQGPLFQRMGSIYALDSARVVFEAEAKTSFAQGEDGFAPGRGSAFVLGDPFLRDVLLQSVQLPLAPDILLPVQIGRIEFFRPAAAGRRSVVLARVQGWEGREVDTDVLALDEEGRVLERLTGYRVRVLEEYPKNPTAEQLTNPESRDQQQLREQVATQLREMGFNPLAMVLGYRPGLHDLSKEQRHEHEQPLIARAVAEQLGSAAAGPVDVKVEWLSCGKPQLSGSVTNNLDLSLTHDDQYCLCVVGSGPQGCDLAPVIPCAAEDCIALLGASREPLIAALMEHGEPMDQAATRIWAAVEAVRKAAGVPQEVGLSIRKVQGDAVLFEAQVATGTFSVLTLPIALTRRPLRVVALVVVANEVQKPVSASGGQHFVEEVDALESEAHPENPTADTTVSAVAATPAEFHAGSFSFDQEKNQKVYQYLLHPTFRECANLSRGVFYSSFAMWMGKVRELCMSAIGPQLVEQIATGEWGLVTNWADVRILGEANAYEPIAARFWVPEVNGSRIRLCCDFSKLKLDRSMERIAIAEQETTWVAVIGHGQVKPAPFPPYLAEFLDAMQQARDGRLIPMVRKPALLATLDPGSVIYQAPSRPEGLPALHSETFGTTLEDSNLVGNVYYANYFVWQGRVRDALLHSLAPEYVRGIGEHGEMICTHSRLDYLRDAMPFERIRVSLFVKSVFECGAVFGFEYLRENGSGETEKLAVGEQKVVWVKRQADRTPLPAPLPDKLRRVLLDGLAPPAYGLTGRIG